MHGTLWKIKQWLFSMSKNSVYIVVYIFKMARLGCIPTCILYIYKVMKGLKYT